MRKFLGVVVLSCILINPVHANGCGDLNFTKEGIRDFHEYLTFKIKKTSSYTFTEPKNLVAFVPNPKDNSYGNVFFFPYDSAYRKVIEKGYTIFSQGAGWSAKNIAKFIGVENGSVSIFAKRNKIIWCKSKEKISRKITLQALEVKMKELGFYDGEIG